MALIETFARLCGTGQSIVTPGVLSTNAFDLGAARTGKTIGGGRLVVARFGVTVALADTGEGRTIDLQILNLNGSAGALAPTALGDSQVNTTTDTITSVAHGLANSTCLVVTSTGALPAGITAARHLFVRNATDDTFQLSERPGGSILDITTTGGAGATITFTEQITYLVSVQGVSIARLNTDGFLEVGLPPPPVSRESFAGRYILARFAASDTLDAGTMTCDLVSGYGMDGQPRNKMGYVTA